ncbi:hypothetical protein [Leucothrix mucor]|jgi:hypothetical protein|uniref:hypothetical protein n=1 Tax=Leucothrix mucor TaxID=45248 RepID=UPI0003B5E5E5|nr:hypothetical protein [Leucothrix mucor]
MSIAETGMEQANTDKVETIERQRLKEKLLRSLENPKSIASGGVSTEDALHEIRQREFGYLVKNIVT